LRFGFASIPPYGERRMRKGCALNVFMIILIPGNSPSLLKKYKGFEYLQVSAGRGDGAALRETTRRRSFHRTRRGRRPSASLCGNAFDFAEESEGPGRCFRESRRHPRAQTRLPPQEQLLKGNQGGKGKDVIDKNNKMDTIVKKCSRSRLLGVLPIGAELKGTLKQFANPLFSGNLMFRIDSRRDADDEKSG
jgi:hypothetical protein